MKSPPSPHRPRRGLPPDVTPDEAKRRSGVQACPGHRSGNHGPGRRTGRSEPRLKAGVLALVPDTVRIHDIDTIPATEYTSRELGVAYADAFTDRRTHPMNGRQAFDKLTKDFTPERRARVDTRKAELRAAMLLQ